MAGDQRTEGRRLPLLRLPPQHSVNLRVVNPERIKLLGAARPSSTLIEVIFISTAATRAPTAQTLISLVRSESAFACQPRFSPWWTVMVAVATLPQQAKSSVGTFGKQLF